MCVLGGLTKCICMRPVFFCRSCFFDLLDELKEWMTSNRLGTYVVQFADLGIRMMEDLADFEVIDNKCARVLDFDSILPFYLSFSLFPSLSLLLLSISDSCTRFRKTI